MRLRGPTYDLNNPAVELEKIVQRLQGELSWLAGVIQGNGDKEIKIYLGELPEDRPDHIMLARYATAVWAEVIGYEVVETSSREEASLVFELLPRDGEQLEGHAGGAAQAAYGSQTT